MITKFVLNTVLHHVGLSRIIHSKKQMKYYIKENNHPDWVNKGPRYSTSICYKWQGTVFDDFIRKIIKKRMLWRLWISSVSIVIEAMVCF